MVVARPTAEDLELMKNSSVTWQMFLNVGMFADLTNEQFPYYFYLEAESIGPFAPNEGVIPDPSAGYKFAYIFQYSVDGSDTDNGDWYGV